MAEGGGLKDGERVVLWIFGATLVFLLVTQDYGLGLWPFLGGGAP